MPSEAKVVVQSEHIPKRLEAVEPSLVVVNEAHDLLVIHVVAKDNTVSFEEGDVKLGRDVTPVSDLHVSQQQLLQLIHLELS